MERLVRVAVIVTVLAVMVSGGRIIGAPQFQDTRVPAAGIGAVWLTVSDDPATGLNISVNAELIDEKGRRVGTARISEREIKQWSPGILKSAEGLISEVRGMAEQNLRQLQGQ